MVTIHDNRTLINLIGWLLPLLCSWHWNRKWFYLSGNPCSWHYAGTSIICYVPWQIHIEKPIDKPWVIFSMSISRFIFCWSLHCTLSIFRTYTYITCTCTVYIQCMYWTSWILIQPSLRLHVQHNSTCNIYMYVYKCTRTEHVFEIEIIRLTRTSLGITIAHSWNGVDMLWVRVRRDRVRSWRANGLVSTCQGKEPGGGGGFSPKNLMRNR